MRAIWAAARAAGVLAGLLLEVLFGVLVCVCAFGLDRVCWSIDFCAGTQT